MGSKGSKGKKKGVYKPNSRLCNISINYYFLDNSGVSGLNTSDPNYKKSTYNPKEHNQTYHQPRRPNNVNKSQNGNSGSQKISNNGKNKNSASNISNLKKSNLSNKPSKAEERRQVAANMEQAVQDLKRKQVKNIKELIFLRIWK